MTVPNTVTVSYGKNGSTALPTRRVVLTPSAPLFYGDEFCAKRSAIANKLASKVRSPSKVVAKATLLSSGNPQIAKADGDAPVQAYIAAMPGWKSALGKRLDALIVRHVPNVRKAVKWNSPLYGIEGQGWFLGVHVFTRYVKVTFFRGTSLHPVPAGGTERSKDAHWIDIREGDELDEAQWANWLKQATALPGSWDPGRPF